MSNYATEIDLKKSTDVHNSDFAHFKYDAYWYIETTPVDFSKLSDAGKNDIVKKTEYDELFKKVNNINTTDTSDFV